MKEETFLKAKAIMDEVEKLRNLKKFRYPAECYNISFTTNSGEGNIIASTSDIGQTAMGKLRNAYVEIIDDLIDKKLKQLEEI